MEAADLVARHHLQVVGETAGRHDVGKSRGNRGVGRGFRAVVLLGLLCRLATKEHGVVGVLVMAEWQEPLVRQFEFAPVSDADFRRTLRVGIAVIRREHVSRQVLDLATALGAADGGAEAIACEGIGQFHAHDIGGIGPAIES